MVYVFMDLNGYFQIELVGFDNGRKSITFKQNNIRY
jgi:hypothetical protein